MLRFFILLALLLASLQADAKKDGLAYLNDIREDAGLIRLKKNKALEKAATSHAHYLIQNQINSHYQKRGKHLFLGETPAKRAIKSGYTSRYVMENLSINTKGYVPSIDNLFSAIYHRFVFLDMDKDEIGYGSFSSKKQRKRNHAYVYVLGASGVGELCQGSFNLVHGNYYMKDICKEVSKMVPLSFFEEKKEAVRRKNRDIILYPYAGQDDIWPAFYNESPDPLPGYKVSGFPVSVQFNPAYYKNVKLMAFRLFDAKGKEIEEIKILRKKNDPNHRFTDLEFALMPLKRLEFNTSYRVYFEAEADGKKVKKEWEFRTIKTKERLYRITQNKSTLKVDAGSTVILYIVPGSKSDIIHHYRVRGGIKVSFLDQNTLKITLPKKSSVGKVGLNIGKRRIDFEVQ